MRSSIRQNLIRAIIIPVLLFAVAYVGARFVRRSNELEAKARQELRDSAVQKALQVQLALSAVEAMAHSMANFMEVSPRLTQAQIYDQLSRTVRQIPAVYGTAIAFEPGAFEGRRRFSPYVCRGVEGLKNHRAPLRQLDIATTYDYIRWQWYSETRRTGKAVWTPPYFDKGAGNILMSTFSVPFFRAGKLRGVATMDIALPVLHQTLHWKNTPETQFIIFDRDGTYVYHPQATRILKDSLFADAKRGDAGLLALANDVAAGRQGFREVEWDGQGQWVGYAPIEPVGWSLGVRSPMRVAFAPVNAELRGMILNAAFVLVAFLTIVYLAVGVLLRPLADFNEAAEQIARGSLNISLDTGRGDELGQLAVAFTNMAERLYARESVLRETRGDRMAQLLQGMEGKLFFYSLRPDGAVDYVSPSVESVLGYNPDEFRSVVRHILTDNPINTMAQAHGVAVLRGESTPVYQIEFRHKDGTARRVEVCERPLLDDEGNVLSVEGLINDVTEQTRAVEWFRNLVDAAPDGIVITDQNERILLVNRKTELIYGYTRDELIGQSAAMLRPAHLIGNHPTWQWNTLERNRQDVGDAMFELFGQRKNGDEFPIEISQQSLLLDSEWGEVVSTTVRDVTERRQAERALRESQQRVSLAAEAGGISFGEQDLHSSEGWINGHVARLIGSTNFEENFKGHIQNHIVPEDRERVAAQREAFLRSDATEYQLEYRIRDLAGEIHWIQVKGKIQRGPSGEAERLIAAMVDVTERRYAAEVLQRTNEQLAERTAELAQALGRTSSRLQGILDNSPAAIWAKDENGVYLFANEAYRAMFSLDDREIVGYTDDNFFPREAAEGFRKNDQKVIKEKKTSSFVERVGLPNGVEYVLSVKFPLFDEAGEVYAAAGMCMDISEQRRLQEELKTLNEELEQRVEERTAELSQAYAALHESEARLSKTTENAPCLIFQFMLRPDGSAYFPYASAWLRAFCGIEPDAVREDGSAVMGLFHPDDVPGYLTVVEEAVRTRSLFQHEWRFLFPDGRVTWVQATSRPEFMDNGEILWNGVLMDITERKQAEQALREREAEIRTLVDNIPGVVYRSEVGGNWTMYFVSDAMAKLTGYPAADFIGEGGRSFASVIHPDDRAGRFEALLASVEEDRPYELEYRLIHLDGSLRWITCMGQVVRDERGNPLYFIGSLFDITQRKLAEEALRESEKRFKSILDNMQGGYLRADMQGMVQFANPGMARVLGYDSPAEIIGKSMAQDIMMYPVDRTRLLEALQRDRTLENFELIFKRKDGTPVVVEDNVHLLYDAAGNAVGVEGLLRDITERKQVEEALRLATQAADESNKAKSDFLANMSHEIRTPMNAIIGMTHLALQTELDNRQRNYLQKIDTSARSLLGIINDILDFSKIEAGKLSMETVEFSLESVFQNVADLFTAKAQERGVEFLFRWEPGVPIMLKGDPLRLGQILINLTGNAFKFTEKGEVEVRVEKISESNNGVTLRFSVCDTGIGLTEAQRSRLFQSFSQADTSTTRKYGGTGLGLTICKRLVEMMQGKIDVKSQPGEGSTFFFTAVFEQPTSVIAKQVPDVKSLPGLRVLSIDDNAASREVLESMLASFRFDVVSASSGESGLETLLSAEDRPFDLVLMDWQMPGMDGIETARRIRSNPQLAVKPPIIMVSAYGREELMQQAAKVGIAGYLIKPVSPSLLLDTVMQVFGKSQDLTTQQIKETQGDDQGALRNLRVLLVEDNEINREVALELLTAAGIDVTTAFDGAQGVEAIRTSAENGRAFEVVLMDCQMPVMDGYEATRVLRSEERFAGLPIIAMTANAMAGDRERCIAAGMNGYLTKPIDVKALFSTLSQWAPERTELKNNATDNLDEDSAATGELDLPGVDVADGLSHMGGNLSLYRRILLKFREGQAAVVGEIRAAKEAGDLELAARLAHTLKGVAGNIGARNLFDAAHDVEHSLKETPEADIEAMLSAVAVRLDPLVAAIAELNVAAGPTNVIGSSVSVDKEALRPLLEKLESLLKRNNTGARDVIAEIDAQMPEPTGRAILAAMSKDIGDYEFEAALARWPELARLVEGNEHAN